MLGKKRYQPKVFTNFNLADRVPENNFYRRLKAVLQLDFLYEKTKPYYGNCGQKSIDTIVFFKSMFKFYPLGCKSPLWEPGFAFFSPRSLGYEAQKTLFQNLILTIFAYKNKF